MSLRDIYAHDAKTCFLNTNDFAEEFTRINEAGEEDTVTGVFVEEMNQGDYVFVASGDETKRQAHFTFSADETVLQTDRLMIRDETWAVNSDATSDGVLKKVSLQLVTSYKHKQARKRGA